MIRLLPSCVAIFAVGCSSGPPSPVDVRDPCNTFASEDAPRKTPELRKGSQGLELVISFTPARNAEADAIHDAARSGPVDLIIHPSKERVLALGEDDAHLVLAVTSDADAERVLKLLCF